jgi:putative molybdopterin biosynthesis protein
VPNTAVGLKLARALEVSVDDIFQLERATPPTPRAETVSLLLEDVCLRRGQPLRICNVNGRLMATVPESGTCGLPPADAVLAQDTGKDKRTPARAKIIDQGWQHDSRFLLAGCDPSAALVARHLQRKGFDMVIAYQNSSRALKLLKQGLIHIAGTDLLDKKTGESNLPKVIQMFGKNSVAVIRFAVWEEGIVVARGNPKGITGIADLARRNVRITNREAGAGCRLLFDMLLQSLGIKPEAVKGYTRIAFGHLPAARQVQSGESDCCISIQAAARIFGLDFVPLITNRYDLVVHRNHLKLPQIQALVEMLGQTAFRRELEVATGYDMHAAGGRIL